MTEARAIVFDAPRTLSGRALALKPFEAADLDVEVGASGIGTGSERLLRDGTMLPCPVQARPTRWLSANRNDLKMKIDWQA